MSVHSLKDLMGTLSRYEALTEAERQAAVVLGDGVGRVLPKGRIYPVFSDDADPALSELEALSRDVSEMSDTLALIEDRLTELKRLRRGSAL